MIEEKNPMTLPGVQRVSRNKHGKRTQEELLRENLYKRKRRQRELGTTIQKQLEESIPSVDKKGTQR